MSGFIGGSAGAIATPVSVPNGGTGLTTILDHGVLVGSGTNPITPLTVGTNGQVLLGSTAADPIFATLTSSDTSVTFGIGAGTLALTVTQATTLQLGGSLLATTAEVVTGTDANKIVTSAGVAAKLGTQTDHGVLIGSGSTNAVTALGVATTGKVLKGVTGLDPAFAALDLTTDVTGILPVPNGGTGVSSIVDHSLVVGSGVGPVTGLGVATDGQLPIGSSGNDPVLGSLTSTTDLAITNGAGSISLDLTANTNIAAVHGWNGSLLETASVTVTAAGGVITLSIEKFGTGNLTAVFSDGFYNWVTAPDTVTLTAGSDTSPTDNFVYLLQSTKTLTASTAGWPATEYAAVANVVCQSAASLQTDGAYKMHAYTDHVLSPTNQGHVSEINRWIRQQNATWESGIGQTLTITPNGGAPDNVIFTSAAGLVYQLHQHTFPAFAGTPDVYTVNDSVTPYNIVTDLNALLTDSTGASMSNKYFSLVIWGVVSEATGDCKLYANLPGGSYNTQSALLSDSLKFANFSIPADFIGTGFLIYQMNLRHQVAASGTWTSISNIDLRGLFPGTAAGGSTSFATEFEDNAFRILDDGDNTKELAFECDQITTATTRTITMDDRDIDMDAVPDTFVSDAGNGIPAAGSLSIVGAGTVSTSAAGSVVTITGVGGLARADATGATQAMAVDTEYTTNRGAGIVDYTLPATAAVGEVVSVTGNSATGWSIAQNAGQTVHYQGLDTTTGIGGSLASTGRYDCIRLKCTVTDTNFVAQNGTGNITVV